MGENVGAQSAKRAAAGAGRYVRHVRIEAGDQAVDDRGQRGPVAVEVVSLRLCVKLLGVAIVSIDQAGEHHPSEHRDLKGCAALVLVPSEAQWEKPAGFGRKLALPGRIESREPFHEALRECAVPAPIGQAGVMAGDAISRNQCGKAIGPRCCCQFLDFSGACRCVVRAWPLAGDVVLKFGRVLSKVMEQSDDGA